MFILRLLLASLPFIRSEAQLKRCYDVLKEENDASETSIFRHIYKTGCFVCSKTKCPRGFASCNNGSLVTIPMYNNIFEIGVSMKYFPGGGGTFNIHYKKNDSCFLKIDLNQNRETKKYGFTFNQCYIHTYDKKRRCHERSTKIEGLIDYNNQYCLYFGLVFFEEYMFVATSFRCNEFASDKFDYSSPVLYKYQNCRFNKDEDIPIAKIVLRQSEERIMDGVPFILPCSPGGFAVDPKSGRFVINEICKESFPNHKTENVGINFLIKKVYNGNENLLFPYGNYREKKQLLPLFMNPSGTAKSSEIMKPTVKPNRLKRNRKRENCNYIGKDDTPFMHSKKEKDKIAEPGDSKVIEKTSKAAKFQLPHFGFILLLLILMNCQ